MLERTIDWASSVLMQRVIDFDRAGQVNTRQEIFPYPEYGSSGLVSLPLPADSKADNIKLGFWGHLQTKGFRAKVFGNAMPDLGEHQYQRYNIHRLCVIFS